MRRVNVWMGPMVAAVLVVAVGLTGCGNTPKPKELKELERILQQEGASDVAEVPGARKFFEDSRDLRRAALDEYEEGNTNRARQLAIRGKIRYRSAVAMKKLRSATQKANEAASKLNTVAPRVKKLGRKRTKLREEVQKLHQQVQKLELDQARERADRIENQQQDDSDDDQKLAAQNQIQRALKAKQSALDVQANKFAKGMYNRAANSLESAKSFRDAGSYERASKTAKEARKSFKKAAKSAKPKYREKKRKENPKKRMAALQEKLESEFANNRVEQTQAGSVRVVMPQLFTQGAKSIDRSSRSDLRRIAELAGEYDEFDIAIDGYTRKGDATKNLTISQVRAQRVKKFLTGEGVDSNRIDTDGHGQKNIRYQDRPSKNDRVEITFLMGSN